MAQPQRFLITADFSDDELNGVAGRSTVRTAMLDAQFAAAQITLDDICDNLAIIQRDDTKLRDLVVEPHTLSTAVRTMMAAGGGTPRGGWLTATAYAAKDMVTQGTGTYICVTAHTSGVFATDLAAVKWLLLFDSANFTAAAVSFAPTGTIAAVTVQAAIAEAASEALQKSNNLSDVANASTSRTNLGVAIANKGGILAGTGGGAIAELAVVEGASLVGDATQAGGLIYVPQYPRSLAPNPFFNCEQWQGGTGRNLADDTYNFDFWYVLTQTAQIQSGQAANQENGQATCCRLTQIQAASQRMGMASIIESIDSRPMRGKQITFRPRVRISNSQVVRMAVLEWTGAADAVTSDVVLDWTNGTFTAGNFFLAANLTVAGVGSKTPAAATWTDMDALTVTVGNACNNLLLFIWTEAVAAQNLTLDIGKVRLVPGTYAGEIYVPTLEEVITYAQRFFEKSFPYAIAPVQNSASTAGALVSAQVGGAATQTIAYHTYKHRKRAVPTITFYNPSNLDAQMQNVTAGGGCTVTAAAHSGEGSFAVTANTAAGSAAGNINAVHWSADCRL